MLLSCPYQPIAETSSQWKELIPLDWIWLFE